MRKGKNIFYTFPERDSSFELEERDDTHVSITHIETNLGLMIAAATHKGICLFEYTDYKRLDVELRQLGASLNVPLVKADNPHLDALREQIGQYFKGERREFDIPLDMVGTEFQKQVWLGLLQIPYGHTITYVEQSDLLGKRDALRAVAGANGRNKISIIVPCHRVIGAKGSLVGYGGGIWRKEKLLKLERKNIERISL
ncbi:MAG: methylated-DNA--[protein]-cysteine S-methyltransferase [Tannerellaceae bacterium]|jgi:AraC family transcriptional regulator of adaptative response/methylated-DNA-[protein]-cysteine methyltransferase|nr:methylated-DNA--[protein]-cysteine S-methyltransferase [Tannerellaceae bacterium]